MGSLTVPNRFLDKYFGYLKSLDNKTKKSLIAKLTESLEKKSKKKFNPESMVGAWVDTRTSDEIIADIRNSQVEKDNTIIL